MEKDKIMFRRSCFFKEAKLMYLWPKSRVDQIEESSTCCRWAVYSNFLLWTRNVVFGLVTLMKFTALCFYCLLENCPFKALLSVVCDIYFLYFNSCSDNPMLSEEKQRILILERVISFSHTLRCLYWIVIHKYFLNIFFCELFTVSDLTYEGRRKQKT